MVAIGRHVSRAPDVVVLRVVQPGVPWLHTLAGVSGNDSENGTKTRKRRSGVQKPLGDRPCTRTARCEDVKERATKRSSH